jgi:hypothetical protein
MITAHTDVVGSLLRPVALRKARDDWVAGRLSHTQFKAIEDRAVDEAVSLQEAAGLDIVTDGLESDHVLAPRQHDPTKRNHVQLRDGIADDRKSLLTNLAIRGNVIWRVDITLIDLVFRNELVNIDRPRALNPARPCGGVAPIARGDGRTGMGD